MIMRWKQLLTPVSNIDSEDAKSYIEKHREGKYVLLDVRQPSEYEKSHIPGAELIPLPQITDRFGELDPEKPTIVYCAMGGRSRAAAQLLSGKGFKEVYNLKGGINAWEGLAAEGPEEAGMLYLKGDETAAEIIILAYGMEAGLGSLYLKLAEMLDEPEVIRILTKLAGIEDKHKEKLYAVYSTLNPAVTDIEAFEADISADVMEGGLTTDEFLTKNKSVMQTLEGVLSIAMMLEAQALDLYLRYSRTVKEEKSKAVLYTIAEDEKAHLAALGKLMEENSNE